jgi:hypothetical protein
MRQESSYGVDPMAGTVLAADIIPMFNCQPNPNIEEIPNLSMAGDIGRLPSVIGIETASVSFSMYYRGITTPFDDSPRVVPEFDRPMRGCALGSTFSTANGGAWDVLTYGPTNTLESMTIYIMQEISGQSTAPTMKILGAFGSMGWTVRAGGVMEFRFAFTGAFGGRSDVTYVAGTPGATPQYATLKSAGFQIDTANYGPRIASVGFDLGNVVSPIPSINAASALAGFFIADRNPRLTIDPEADLVANYDWVTKWRAGNLADIDFTLGSAQYARIKPIFPKAQIVNQSYTQRDGLTAWPTSFLASINSGLDDFSIVCL